MVKEFAVYRFVDDMSVCMEPAPGLRVEHTEQELVGVYALWGW